MKNKYQKLFLELIYQQKIKCHTHTAFSKFILLNNLNLLGKIQCTLIFGE